MQHDPLKLEGLPLDYALAMTLDFTEPFYGVGKIRYIPEENYFLMEEPDPDEPDEITKPEHFTFYSQWNPTKQGWLLYLLINKHGINLHWEDKCPVVEKDGIVHKGESLGVVIAQLLVACKYGNFVELPDHIK